MAKVTMSDVARKAGISRKYVSGILNNREDVWVSEETRRKVLDVVEELNYQPNQLARSLKDGRTMTIGVTSGTGIELKALFADPFFSHLYAGIGDAAARRGFRVLFQQSSDALPGETSIEMARTGMTDGVVFILLSEYLDDFEKKQLPRLRKMGVPFTVIMMLRRPYDAPVAFVDSRQEIYKAVCHLLEHGYTDIMHMGWFSGNPFDAAAREGFKQALKERGVPCDDARFVDAGDINAFAGYACIDRMLKEGGRIPRAFFIGRTELARGVERRLAEAGVRMPEDCALAAYGLITREERQMSAVTTVSQPVQETGQAAAEMLFDILDGKKVDDRMMMGTLVKRRSCGC